MTVIEERQATTSPPDAEALIKEARQRQHRRRSFISVVVLVLAVAAGIWAASNGGSATKPPTSPKNPGQLTSPSAPGAANSSHAKPLQLVGIWRVIAPGEHSAPIVSMSGLGLVLWTSCGWMSGSWNANRTGMFVSILDGGVPACLLGPRSKANLNPRWLNATASRRTGRDELLLGANGLALARLLPATVPRALAKGQSPENIRPVVTSRLRKTLLLLNSPLPAGLVPAVGRQIVGRWVPANPPIGHWHRPPYLSFDADGWWSGSDGCNGLGGRWSIGHDGTLIVVSAGSTFIGCTNVDVGEWLSGATRVTFHGPTLVLVDAAGGVTGRFRRG
jgi:heat shock protein HslJ